MPYPAALESISKNPVQAELPDNAILHNSADEATKSILNPLKSSSLDYSVLSENIGETIEFNVNAFKDFSIEISEVFTGSKAPKQRAILLTIFRKTGGKKSFLINIGQLLSKISVEAKLSDNSGQNGNVHFENIYHSLSLREQQVLVVVSTGLTSKEIASKLFISENTVKNHRKNIKKKLGFKASIDYSRFLKWAKDYCDKP